MDKNLFAADNSGIVAVMGVAAFIVMSGVVAGGDSGVASGGARGTAAPGGSPAATSGLLNARADLRIAP